MKILVIGYGSIGKRHVQNLLCIPNMEVLICTHQQLKKCEKNKHKLFKTIEDAIREKPDAAIICSVTNKHIEDATKLAKAGVNLLIEKPLSNSLCGTNKLLTIVKKEKIITLLGCNLRFHPCIIKIKNMIFENQIGRILSVVAENGSYLPDWYPKENYKNSYAARNDLGGGVLLTSIHEIDYLYWFFGNAKEIFSITGKFSNLQISADDLSFVLLRFKNIIAEIHLDYFQRPHARSLKIIGTQGTIYWNFDDNIVKMFDVKKNKWIIKLKLKNYDYNCMYKDELNYFIDCIYRKKQTLNPLEDGIKILKIALAAKRSNNTKRIVFLD